MKQCLFYVKRCPFFAAFFYKQHVYLHILNSYKTIESKKHLTSKAKKATPIFY